MLALQIVALVLVSLFLGYQVYRLVRGLIERKRKKSASLSSIGEEDNRKEKE